MHIICTQENLKLGLLAVGKITTLSNTLPVLGTVLLKAENGMLQLSATNLEIAVQTQVRCKVEEVGAFSVNCKTFTDLVNNFPNKNISLKLKDSAVEVDSENYHTKIKTFSAEEFPLIPPTENLKTVNVKAQEFKKAAGKVVFSASTNQTQPEISGILFGFRQNQLKLAATDRYRLAEKKIFISEEVTQPGEVIVPAKAVLEAVRIASAFDGDMSVGWSLGQAVFVIGGTTIFSRLVDGQYPPYEQIIPASFQAEAVVKKQDLVGALKAVGVFSQNNSSMVLDYNNESQKFNLSSEAGDLGTGSVELEAEISGGSGSLVVNFHYLLDALQNMDSDKIKFRFNDDSSAILVVPIEEKDYLYLVMPIKT